LKTRTGSVQELIKTGRRYQVCTFVKDGKVFCSAAHVKQGENRWGLVQELSGSSQGAHVNREELIGAHVNMVKKGRVPVQELRESGTPEDNLLTPIGLGHSLLLNTCKFSFSVHKSLILNFLGSFPFAMPQI
jgi:hypothetical protein